LIEKEEDMEIQVFSTAFQEGGAIPVQYTCEGGDLSPPLMWGRIPQETQSLALICEDPDAPSGRFVHWIIFNLPPPLTDLPEAVPTTATLEEGGVQGRNDFKRLGYSGPCPPPKQEHRYFFRLSALDAKLQLEAGATKFEFDRAIEGHILASGHLMGTYQRK
jgi:Raf kinase inhibitor-like YbhB/YbcL family protein